MRNKIWLDIVQRLLELTGNLRPERHNGAIIPARWYRFYCASLAGILLSSFVMAVGYAMSADFAYMNRLEATIYSLGFLKGFIIIVWFIRINNHVVYVLVDLQTRFDFLHGKVSFMRANRRATQIANVFIYMYGIAVVVMNMSPFLLVAYFQVIREPFALVLPLKMKLPFETSTFCGYTIGYVHQLSASANAAFQIAAANVVYSGGCLYAIAHLEHLTELFVTANNKFLLNKNPRVLRMDLITAVRTHTEFIEWMENLEAIMSGIVFIQIMMSGLLSSMSIFCIMNGDYKFIFPLADFLLDTFFYCLLSSILKHRYQRSADILYNLQWYEYPVRSQRFILLAIHQMQRAEYLKGFDFLNSLGSMIAVLQAL